MSEFRSRGAENPVGALLSACRLHRKGNANPLSLFSTRVDGASNGRPQTTRGPHHCSTPRQRSQWQKRGKRKSSVGSRRPSRCTRPLNSNDKIFKKYRAGASVGACVSEAGVTAMEKRKAPASVPAPLARRSTIRRAARSRARRRSDVSEHHPDRSPVRFGVPWEIG
jgi:hypothetical protein